MSSKTIHRDPISGHFHADDIQPGTHSVSELSARLKARQEAINAAHVADWQTANSMDSPAYGDAMSRMPKPTDVNGKGADRYGVSVAPGEQKAKQPSRTGKPAGK